MGTPHPKETTRCVTCDYCGGEARLVAGDRVYPGRGDLWRKSFWSCEPCAAWVGCHDGTDVPLGRLANAGLRRAKMDAHAVFDPLWKAKAARGERKNTARSKGYRWLAEQLGIPANQTHIEMFDEPTCVRVKEICWPHLERLRARERA